MLAGCSPTAFPVASKTETLSPQHMNPGGDELRAAHLVTPISGWVLTINRLLITGDGGRTWSNVTPPSIVTTGSALPDATFGLPGSAPAPNASALETAFFLNPSRGWVVRSARVNMGSDQAPLDLLTTSDSGKHWSVQRIIATIPFDTPGPVYLTFVDAMRGWLVVDQGSHSGFMYYTGFRTSDGGQTWSTLSYPQSGPVLFINHLDGFSASGADGPTSGTYVTHDGGLSWARLVVPPARVSAVAPLFQMPVFSDDRNGVLGGGVPDRSGGTAAEVFYKTSDGGRSWSLAGTVPNPNPPSNAHLTSVMNAKVWLAAFLGPGPIAGRTYTRLKATHNGGRSWQWMPTALSGAVMNEISFNGSTGWAIVVDAGCLGFKTDCFTNFGLFQTIDSGAHWLRLSVT